MLLIFSISNNNSETRMSVKSTRNEDYTSSDLLQEVLSFSYLSLDHQAQSYHLKANRIDLISTNSVIVTLPNKQIQLLMAP